jgi:hypothetical protein
MAWRIIDGSASGLSGRWVASKSCLLPSRQGFTACSLGSNWLERSRTPHNRPAQRFTLLVTSLLSAVMGEPNVRQLEPDRRLAARRCSSSLTTARRRACPRVVWADRLHGAIAGLGHTSNGALLNAEAAGFDLLLTTGRRIRHQQNLQLRRIAFVVLPGTRRWSPAGDAGACGPPPETIGDEWGTSMNVSLNLSNKLEPCDWHTSAAVPNPARCGRDHRNRWRD